MPPPLPPQQGSRAGLITAIVVFAMASVVMTVLYFAERAEKGKSDQRIAELEGRYKDVISDSELGDVQPLIDFAARNDPESLPFRDLTAFGVKKKQCDNLIAAIGATSYPSAMAQADRAVTTANETLSQTSGGGEETPAEPAGTTETVPAGAGDDIILAAADTGADAADDAAAAPAAGADAAADTPDAAATDDAAAPADTDAAAAPDAAATPADDAAADDAAAPPAPRGNGGGGATAARSNMSLTDAIRQLASQAVTLKAESDALKDEIARLGTTSGSALAAHSAALKQKDEQIKQIQEQVAATEARIKEYEEASKKGVETLGTSLQAQVNSLNREKSSLQSSINRMKGEYKEAKEKLDTTIQKLRLLRGGTEGEPLVRQPDGLITRLPGNNVAFINLGFGDGIHKGMTFAVYDRITGIPPLGDGQSEDDYPVSKAEIEVVRIRPGASECRIVKVRPGHQLVQGDLVMNLIYDKNTKYNFVIHGDFDLDNDGTATGQDGSVLERLVTQWGGRMMEKVNANTDFVVLGREPEMPNIPEEDKETPEGQQLMAKYQADLARYNTVRNTAIALNIPIMNQNRFLYYVGYYEQRER